MTDPTNPAPVPPRPSPDFERYLDDEVGSNITRFPRVVTTSLPEDDCSGPPFDPSPAHDENDWLVLARFLRNVAIAVVIAILVVATVAFFGG